MTTRQHILTATVLGYPACCIAEWIENPTRAAVARGSVNEGQRTAPDMARIEAALTPLLGAEHAAAIVTTDPFKRYVPCSNCAGDIA